jgi:hypothetical protein
MLAKLVRITGLRNHDCPKWRNVRQPPTRLVYRARGCMHILCTIHTAHYSQPRSQGRIADFPKPHKTGCEASEQSRSSTRWQTKLLRDHWQRKSWALKCQHRGLLRLMRSEDGDRPNSAPGFSLHPIRGKEPVGARRLPFFHCPGHSVARASLAVIQLKATTKPNESRESLPGRLSSRTHDCLLVWPCVLC